MPRNQKQMQGNTAENEVSQSAALSVIAGLITTLGDGLETVASALAIQEAEQSNNSKNDEIQAIKQQLNALSKDV